MLKYCALFSLCAGVGLAGDFFTGQAARLVIGQTSFTSQISGASDTLLGGVGGLAFAANTLFVADSNKIGFTPVNNRVLLFQNVSQTMPTPLAEIPAYSGMCPVCVGQAGLVLGQPDFLSVNPHTSQTGLRTANGVASDGRILAIADTDNNRVLIWNSIPVTNGQPADVLLGQPDFNTVQPVIVNASTFRGPQGVWIQNGKLMVADTQNNRILIWNSIPTKNNQPADVELGQPNFTKVGAIPVAESALAPTASTMLDPTSVSSDGIHLFVADLGYNRVLIWNSIPTQNFEPANVELGQIDFVSAVPDDNIDLCPAGTDRSGLLSTRSVCGKTMDSPRFVLSDGTRLFVADGGNDRVLIYNQIPTQNAAEAGHRPGAAGRIRERGQQHHVSVHASHQSVRLRHHTHTDLARLGWNQSLRGGPQQSAYAGIHSGGTRTCRLTACAMGPVWSPTRQPGWTSTARFKPATP